MPWEADAFYDQPGLKNKNITLDWFPVGTGPYWLEENNPNRRMVLTRNPYYHPDFYPTEGDVGDREAGSSEHLGAIGARATFRLAAGRPRDPGQRLEVATRRCPVGRPCRVSTALNVDAITCESEKRPSGPVVPPLM